MTHSLSRLQTFYAEHDPHALLHAMITREFKDNIACFSSFGAYSGLLLKMVAEIDPNTPILFLNTGKHFQATLDYVNDISKYVGLTNVIHIHPNPDMVSRIDPNGDLWESNVDRCCWMRKVDSLESYLQDNPHQAIITGRRRYQTKEREALEPVELDEDGTYKINPFWNTSKDDIKQQFEALALPQHPLVAKGYPSIGCETCTRAVKPGEDERSGRWAHAVDMSGKQKTECGIHLPTAEQTDWSV